jgi:hypothetical protein
VQAAPPGEVEPGGRRPNTAPPRSYIALSDEQARSMSNEQLLYFLDQTLGVRLPLDTPRTVIYSKLEALSVAARDV